MRRGRCAEWRAAPARSVPRAGRAACRGAAGSSRVDGRMGWRRARCSAARLRSPRIEVANTLPSPAATSDHRGGGRARRSGDASPQAARDRERPTERLERRRRGAPAVNASSPRTNGAALGAAVEVRRRAARARAARARRRARSDAHSRARSQGREWRSKTLITSVWTPAPSEREVSCSNRRARQMQRHTSAIDRDRRGRSSTNPSTTKTRGVVDAFACVLVRRRPSGGASGTARGTADCVARPCARIGPRLPTKKPTMTRKRADGVEAERDRRAPSRACRRASAERRAATTAGRACAPPPSIDPKRRAAPRRHRLRTGSGDRAAALVDGGASRRRSSASARAGSGRRRRGRRRSGRAAAPRRRSALRGSAGSAGGSGSPRAG